MTISICDVVARYHHSREISGESARDFVAMIERGLSIDAVIEIMSHAMTANCKHSHDIRNFTLAKNKLIRNPIIRESALFCTLLGVKQIMLAEFNDAKFDDLKSAEMWLQLHGYSKLSRHQYRDCIQAWIKKESVAKVQSLPSGKFLVQEFKIV